MRDDAELAVLTLADMADKGRSVEARASRLENFFEKRLHRGVICPAVGHVPSALQGVNVSHEVGWPPQTCDVCGRERVKVDPMMKLTLHERADR